MFLFNVAPLLAVALAAPQRMPILEWSQHSDIQGSIFRYVASGNENDLAVLDRYEENFNLFEAEYCRTNKVEINNEMINISHCVPIVPTRNEGGRFKQGIIDFVRIHKIKKIDVKGGTKFSADVEGVVKVSGDWEIETDGQFNKLDCSNNWIQFPNKENGGITYQFTIHCH